MAEKTVTTCPSVCAPSGTDRRTEEKSPSLLELARRRLAKPVLPGPSPIEAPSVLVSDLVWEWFQIALDEGHVEPSQPVVGLIVGWPMRSFTENSLLVDFRCLCMQKGFVETDRERDKGFQQILERVFDVDEGRVTFPSVDESRQRFKQVKEVKI